MVLSVVKRVKLPPYALFLLPSLLFVVLLPSLLWPSSPALIIIFLSLSIASLLI